MNTSAITPKQANYNLAVAAGKKELLDYTAEKDLHFYVKECPNNIVTVSTSHNGVVLFTAIEYDK